MGTMGVVALAKRRGLVSAAVPIFTALEEAGLFLSKALIREVLSDLGEARKGKVTIVSPPVFET
jgi:predicted nucleic acid-binding protein